MSALLLKLPTEVAESILVAAEPRDIAAFSGTCASSYRLVYRSADNHLWRSVFLSLFDDPRWALQEMPFDWKRELQRRIQMRTLAFADSGRATPLSENTTRDVLNTLLSILATAAPASFPGESKNLRWIEPLLNNLNNLRGDAHATSQQLLSRLGCFRSEARSVLDVHAARRAIYERDHEIFFTKTKTIDWQVVAAAETVISANMRGRESAGPMDLESVRAYSAPGLDVRNPKDWAGAEGKWCRALCSWNYSELNEDEHDDAIIIERVFETTRVVNITLEIASYSENSQNSEYPTINLRGTYTDANPETLFEVRMRGSVRLTASGEIVWNLISTYAGVDEWICKGAQLGQFGSARGFAGIWGGATREWGDPVGPFWMWKTG